MISRRLLYYRGLLHLLNLVRKVQMVPLLLRLKMHIKVII
ncbi:Uncharacterised protein [Mycobacterium tuberculosis]|nr:Uncharacterised protein [Mycobacterium tuberculosis]